MSMLSIASRTALEAEREDGERKMASFLPQIWDLRNNLPQNTPQIGLLCYTISSAVRRAVSPIEGLKHNLPDAQQYFGCCQKSGKPD